MHVSNLGKTIGSFTSYDLTCFNVYSKTYSPTFNLDLVPIWYIRLGKVVVMLELWLIGAQLVAQIMFNIAYLTLNFLLVNNPCLG